MNIFLFHRDLRIHDNTTLNHQIRELKAAAGAATPAVITPIFIFPPEQISPAKNPYFSNNSVQFMVESLDDLVSQIRAAHGEGLLFFRGDNLAVLKKIHKLNPINSIGFNIDYTPYAKLRDEEIEKWCAENKITVYKKEDYVLHDILEGSTTKPTNGEPYKVFTPFKSHCQKSSPRKPEKLPPVKFVGAGAAAAETMSPRKLKELYKENPDVHIHGGRKNGLKILGRISNWRDYNKCRDFLTYETTSLSAHNHFSTVSIREVYWTIRNKLSPPAARDALINELYWRDFYLNIAHFFPKVLSGRKGGARAFQQKYARINWSSSRANFEKWCEGQTGFPLIDAAQRQLNATGYMHNRARMCTAMFLTKDLHISWEWGEQYFAQNLVDYSPAQNNGGWQWASSTGTDAQPYFRVFNPWTQAKNFDPECEYIKKWVPELAELSPREIHNWWRPEVREAAAAAAAKYPAPIVDHDEARKKTLQLFRG
jgi:deoxyribodipyrimidine photo-lyase